MRGITLMKACMTMERKYGCRFEFCKPEDAGARIMEILNKNMVGVK
jgi:ribosome-associated protein